MRSLVFLASSLLMLDLGRFCLLQCNHLLVFHSVVLTSCLISHGRRGMLAPSLFSVESTFHDSHFRSTNCCEMVRDW